MNTLTQYVSRSVDLAIWGVDWEKTGIQSVDFSLSSLITTGTYKILQQVVIWLLTSRGSKSFLPEEGSAFLDKLYQGSYDQELIKSIVQISLDELKKRLNQDAIPEEEIETLTVTELSYNGGVLDIQIELKLTQQEPVIAPVRVTLK